MASGTCGAYTRPSSFRGEGKTFGMNEPEGSYTKGEAWPFWASAEAVKLQVGQYIYNSQNILSASGWGDFNGRFQQMNADFDREWIAVKGYSDSWTKWCKYIKRGIEWDTQFKLLKRNVGNAIAVAEAQAAKENAATPAKKEEKKAAQSTASGKKAASSGKQQRSTQTQAAVASSGGDTTKAADTLAAQGATAGSVGGPDWLMISLYATGGLLLIGTVWALWPTKSAVAGLGGGRRRRRLPRKSR